MIRTEISLFMKNKPGELGKLTSLFAQNDINIDALTIQDASSYVKELFKARGRSLNRIASPASYNSMRKDSMTFALVRLLVNKNELAMDILARQDYLFDITPVVAIELENHPGALADVALKFGEKGININYVYGSVQSPDAKCLFVFCPEDVKAASELFDEK